ncbi:MAG TPA: UDP-N-acetylmuramoyl-L-alanine--D-glutamate ligase [Polyangia bacterium]|nr:UDP-N-acetylmuramoyl-L-alanine--D-glutamate ligase [Polyangia bacterium]
MTTIHSCYSAPMLDSGKTESTTLPAEPVGVLGVGVEGRATIEYLLGRGMYEVTALDRQPVEELPPGVTAVFGEGYDQGLGRFATVFRSPSVRPDHPELERARNKGTRVTSALSFFLERCPVPVAGVTGTVGKGTCSSMIAAVLRAAGFTVHLGGNIGRSPLEFLGELRADDRVVLEVSSFQAMDLSAWPNVAVILKTTSEHLDWHLDTDEYRSAKAGLVRGQRPTDRVIHHADSPGAEWIAAQSPANRLGYSIERELENGLFLRDDRLVLREGGVETALPVDFARVRLPGRFNLENLAAGLLAGRALGAWGPDAWSAAETFESLPHRLELVCEANRVRYYNDSYATRPEAAIAAINSFGGPLALVMGGSEKNADFGDLARAMAGHQGIVHVSLIGATAGRLAAAFASAGIDRFRVETYPDLEPAVVAAASALGQGPGTVLLAPACASFGLFQNYKVRGERFRNVARKLCH